MPNVPYNTGKVKIGCHYVPPQQNMNTPESEHWQEVFKGGRRDTSEVWRWVLLVVVAFCFGYWGFR